jgi:hypothetical protein
MEDPIESHLNPRTVVSSSYVSPPDLGVPIDSFLFVTPKSPVHLHLLDSGSLDDDRHSPHHLLLNPFTTRSLRNGRLIFEN